MKLLMFYNFIIEFKMTDGSKQSRRILLLMISVMLIMGINATLNSVSVSSSALNSIATYTWSISFTGGTPYLPLTLTFPTQVTLLSNLTVTIGTSQPFTTSSNTITITSGITTASVSIVIGNVQNPSSAISTYAFSYTNSNDGTVSLNTINQVQYQVGGLSSCPWSFTLCTEQPSSDLLISITSINKFLPGSNYFLIGYTTTWPNHYTKGLVTSVASLSCSYSTNAGSTYSAATSCTIDTLNNRINFQFSTVTAIAGGTSFIVKISGVNAPPTMQTSTSSSYYIYSADSSMVKIDGATNCVINNVCVTSETVGTFSNTTMIVNANYGNPQVLFPTTPLYITIQPLDSIDVSFSPISSLMSCNTLNIYRSGSPLYTLRTPTSGSTSITFTFPSTSGYNTEYTFSITANLQCTAFLLPPSETPSTLSFTFKRNADTYLVLSSPIAATATTFNSSKAVLSLSSTAMIAASTLTFNFLNGQPLGSTPAITIIFPTEFTLASPTCTVAILSLTITNGSCSFTNSTNTIRVTLTASSSISSGSNFTITVSGVTNPSTPKSYSFPMTTYYDAAVATSRVEFSLSAFTTTITEIANYPVTLSPSGLTVYSPTTIILAFVPTINIPVFSSFYIQFPSGVTSVLPNTNLLSVGGTAQPLNGTVSTSNTTIVTFTSGAVIATGSNVSISILATTPGNIGTYSYVKLIISNNSTNYLSSMSSLYLNVNAVNSMSVTITPVTSTTGSTSSYQFNLVLSIPHPTSFIVQIDVPTDTKFISSGATCTNCNTTSISPTNSTTFSFIASNPSGTAATSIIFIITSFTNPRSVGSSMAWGVATKTVSPVNLISYTSGSASIQSPNGLAASLSKSDSYYRSNSNPVKINFGFYNKLVSGDYILLTFTSDSYTASSVTCSSIYGTCSIVGTPSNVTLVKIIPNITSIISNSLFLILEGLTSAPATPYPFSTTISATTLTSADALIDSGSITYNISCGTYSANLCKQCYNNGTCINCYTGYYLQGTVCVSLCGPPTLYMSYAVNSSESGTCVSCINNCLTCDSATICRSCITNYYLYTTTSTCQFTCPTTNGYFTSNGLCSPCITNCLECTNGSNSCTRCDSTTLLINGLCQNGCGSTNYYQLNGQCLSCDVSCYNCSGAGAGSCYVCSANYHKYITLCVSQCPNGTAVSPSTGECGCDSLCLTCSTYTACTACMDATMWVLNGNCIAQCPTSTYANAGQCVACSSGCLTCTINTCTACVNTSYLFNNSCYSDCNLISQQYDAFGSSCVLCPSGCDHCSGVNCTSCLDAYTLSSGQCIKTCLLSNTCDLNAQVLPLPGLISLVLWIGISVVIHCLYHKNYLPYSFIFASGVIQFVLMLALIASLGSISSRLLAADTTYLTQMRGLLGAAIAVNYLENITYIIIFVCYIKPLITNPRQIDVISNVVAIVIATITNYRFGLIAFARIFPKPNIYVQNASKLTPIHYLCMITLCLDLLSVVACGLGLIYSQKLSNTFMLSMDLLIVILVNFAFTIWFVATSKPDEYFDQFVKKYHTEDNLHNPTDETLPNQKNLSKANMVANESFNFDDFDRTENDDSFNKLTTLKPNHTHNLADEHENPLPITVSANKKTPHDPFIDPDFENNLKSKRISNPKNPSVIASKAEDHKKSENNLSSSKTNALSARKSISPRKANGTTANSPPNKEPTSQRKRADPQKNILEVEESDYPELQENSSKDPAAIFPGKQRQPKPKKMKDSKAKLQEPLKVMKKGDKRIGYFQSDAYESNADGEDLEEIIKQKIWQSTIKLEKPALKSQKDDETAHEEISPSWFNIQNQRLDITDLEDADPE